MRLLPYDTLTIETTAPLEVARERLTAQVATPSFQPFQFGQADQDKPYEGKVGNRGFSISRCIQGRNSFLPQIEGRFEPQTQGCRIYLSFQLHPLVLVFLGLWFFVWYGAVVPIFIALVLQGELQGKSAKNLGFAVLFLLAPLAFLVIGWYAFWLEVKRSRREMQQIFLGEVI
jgi:hypothetical protein